MSGLSVGALEAAGALLAVQRAALGLFEEELGRRGLPDGFSCRFGSSRNSLSCSVVGSGGCVVNVFFLRGVVAVDSLRSGDRITLFFEYVDPKFVDDCVGFVLGELDCFLQGGCYE